MLEDDETDTKVVVDNSNRILSLRKRSIGKEIKNGKTGKKKQKTINEKKSQKAFYIILQ